MNYRLTKDETKLRKTNNASFKGLWVYLKDDIGNILIGGVALLIHSIVSIMSPYLIGKAIDKYISNGNSSGLLSVVLLLCGLSALGTLCQYTHILYMGKTGQKLLFRLRSELFSKLQELPYMFFKINKSGDLISRINNDTEKLNQFFSETLVRFMGNIFILSGIAVVVVFLNTTMGLSILFITLFMVIFTLLLSPILRQLNKKNLDSFGIYTSDVKENLSNFKAVVAFGKRKYFVERLKESSDNIYKSAIRAGVGNSLTIPMFDFTGNISMLVVLVLGILLISKNAITVGLLISYIAYVDKYFRPLRIISGSWASLQTAKAAWVRIYRILEMKSNLNVKVMNHRVHVYREGDVILEFKNVDFAYDDGLTVLRNINFKIKKSQTVALIGPTGGGKSTTAQLMARLFDPSHGIIELFGRDIKTYTAKEISKHIGFIVQDPILFSGTIGQNLIYGNDKFEGYDNIRIMEKIRDFDLEALIEKFDRGLDTVIEQSAEFLSLGQKQIIAFIRVVLREPDILILDEATANIDTVTEKILNRIISKIPKSTTKILIAHRLNTIKKADEIIFINEGSAKKAISFEEGLKMIKNSQRKS